MVSQDRGCSINGGDVAQDARTQEDLLVRLRIFSLAIFVIGSGGVVCPGVRREMLFRNFFEIVQVDDVG